MHFKPCTFIVRLVLQLTFVLGMLGDGARSDSLCGDITLRPTEDLVWLIVGLEAARLISTGLLLGLIEGGREKDMDTVPRLLEILISIGCRFVIILYQSHRLAYYLHSFLIEAIILLISGFCALICGPRVPLF